MATPSLLRRRNRRLPSSKRSLVRARSTATPSAIITATASRTTRPRAPTSSAFRTRPTKWRRSCASARAIACRSSPSAPAPRSKATSTRSTAASRIDLREMNRVVRVSVEDLDTTVEAGVTRLQLNKALSNTGLDLPGRSRRRRDDRRHGGDTCIGHHRRPLRHDARERARPDGRARRRHGHPYRHARAQVVGRLRPDAPVRRLRRHARRHHRGDAAAASAVPRRCRPRCARSTRSRARSRR